MPHSYIRLSAGRESLSDSDQALAFMAGQILCSLVINYLRRQIQVKVKTKRYLIN